MGYISEEKIPYKSPDMLHLTHVHAKYTSKIEKAHEHEFIVIAEQRLKNCPKKISVSTIGIRTRDLALHRIAALATLKAFNLLASGTLV